MITVVLVSFIFAAGMLTAYVSWEQQINEIMTFSNITCPVSILGFEK
jgi:uncharacterized protein HemY